MSFAIQWFRGFWPVMLFNGLSRRVKGNQADPRCLKVRQEYQGPFRDGLRKDQNGTVCVVPVSTGLGKSSFPVSHFELKGIHATFVVDPEIVGNSESRKFKLVSSNSRFHESGFPNFKEGTLEENFAAFVANMSRQISPRIFRPKRKHIRKITKQSNVHPSQT